MYFFLCIISYFYSIDKNDSIKGISRHLPFVFIPFSITVINNKHSESLLKALRQFIVVTCFFFVILIIKSTYKFWLNGDISNFLYHKFADPFMDNAIYMSLLVLMAIVLFLFNSKIKFNRIQNVLIGICLYIFIVLLSSKLIIFVSIILVLLKLCKEKNIYYLFILLIPLALSPFFYDRFLDIYRNLNINYILNGDNFFNYEWNGFTLRLFQQRIGYEMIINQPFEIFRGVGINASQKLIDMYYEYYHLNTWFYKFNFHNQYLQTFVELGIIGLLSLIIFFSVYLYKSFMSKDLFSIIIISIFLILFFTESYLDRQKGVYIFVAFMSLLTNRKFNLKNK